MQLFDVKTCILLSDFCIKMTMNLELKQALNIRHYSALTLKKKTYFFEINTHIYLNSTPKSRSKCSVMGKAKFR